MPPLASRQHIRAEKRRFQRARAGQTWSVRDLPKFYYHKNFCEIINGVEHELKHLVCRDSLEFIENFRALPFPAQCAYVRMATRKGHIFSLEKFNYPEIEQLEVQLALLKKKGFICNVSHLDQRAYLNSLTKTEIQIQVSKHVCETKYRRSWKKDKLVNFTIDEIKFDNLIIGANTWVQTRRQPLDYLLFLHSGRTENNLQKQTLRDLGLVKTPVCPDGRENRDKLLHKLGRSFEQGGDIEKALTAYTHSDTDLCNERVVRIRYKMGETSWVKSRLEEMIEEPSSDEEHAFAQDFYARKFNKKRISIVTDILRGAKTIHLDEAYRNQPERAALSHFQEKGLTSFRMENTPWRTLFGLLFWDELYEKGVTNSLPTTLKSGQFYERLQALIETSPKGAVASMLRLMVKDWKGTKDGFPDLMIVESNLCRFIEIKAEGDVIRKHQLTRLRQLKTFAEIADSFANFMGDAIFAAHNVNFDYGFINAEFKMIDRQFRHPKICTCSSMRKLYPGYASYSLKNLCREFQIDLKSHHRALCDAKAAAELLFLINTKRLENQ